MDKAEQTFFVDPALDRAFGVVMAPATEVDVLKDRLPAIEDTLDPQYRCWRFPWTLIAAERC